MKAESYRQVKPFKGNNKRGDYHEKVKGKRNQAPAGTSEGRRYLFAQVAVPLADGAVQYTAGPEQDPSETTEALMEVMADETGEIWNY